MPADLHPSDERLAAALRDGGHRVTSQRLILHRVLGELGRHATAEEIARAAGGRLPGLSLPTVYATLELFERLGLVRRVSTGGTAVLFDPRPEPHQHFVCRRCGRVEDVEAAVDEAALAAGARRAGLSVDDVEVLLRGLCPACSTRASAPRA
jgi:Fur family ferric uptake transcriptional regulator/Fur family peroxide stress response transcriptional regulator